MRAPPPQRKRLRRLRLPLVNAGSWIGAAACGSRRAGTNRFDRALHRRVQRVLVVPRRPAPWRNGSRLRHLPHDERLPRGWLPTRAAARALLRRTARVSDLLRLPRTRRRRTGVAAPCRRTASAPVAPADRSVALQESRHLLHDLPRRSAPGTAHRRLRHLPRGRRGWLPRLTLLAREDGLPTDRPTPGGRVRALPPPPIGHGQALRASRSSRRRPPRPRLRHRGPRARVPWSSRAWAKTVRPATRTCISASLEARASAATAPSRSACGRSSTRTRRCRASSRAHTGHSPAEPVTSPSRPASPRQPGSRLATWEPARAAAAATRATTRTTGRWARRARPATRRRRGSRRRDRSTRPACSRSRDAISRWRAPAATPTASRRERRPPATTATGFGGRTTGTRPGWACSASSATVRRAGCRCSGTTLRAPGSS